MRKFFILALAVSLLAVSCETEFRSTVISQEAMIEKFINDSLSRYEIVRNDGVNRAILVPGSGNVVEKGDNVTFDYVGCVLSDGKLAAFTQGTLTKPVGSGELIKGLDLGLVGAKRGEECMLIFSAEYGYGKGSLNVVPEAQALAFDVKIVSISKSDD